MIYLHLYNEPKGLSPQLTKQQLAGPLLGPVSAIKWNRGFISLRYVNDVYTLDMTDHCDHIRYAFKIYNAFEILDLNTIELEAFCFDNEPVSVHNVEIFKSLINL